MGYPNVLRTCEPNIYHAGRRPGRHVAATLGRHLHTAADQTEAVRSATARYRRPHIGWYSYAPISAAPLMTSTPGKAGLATLSDSPSSTRSRTLSSRRPRRPALPPMTTAAKRGRRGGRSEERGAGKE